MYKKLAIYLLALLSNIGTVLISPIMAEMAVDFPDAGTEMLGIVVTLPAFTLIPATLFVSSVLITKMERKNIIWIAYVLALIGGIGPAFTGSLPLIMVLRAVLGIGMGLLTPIGITYVSQYPEDERPAMIGYTQTINCLLAAGLLLLVAPVSRFAGWRGVFIMYGVLVIPFIIGMTGIPRTGKLGSRTKADGSEEKVKVKLGRKAVTSTIIFCITLFFTMSVEGAVVSSISFYIEHYQLGGAQLASIASSIGPAGLAIGAMLFPIFMKRFKNWTAVIFLVTSGISLLIYSTHTVASVIIGYCLYILLNALYALFTSTIISLVVPIQRVALIHSITLIAIFSGQFIAPSFQAWIAKLLHLESTDAMVYAAMAVIIFVMAVVNIPFKKKSDADSAAAAA